MRYELQEYKRSDDWFKNGNRIFAIENQLILLQNTRNPFSIAKILLPFSNQSLKSFGKYPKVRAFFLFFRDTLHPRFYEIKRYEVQESQSSDDFKYCFKTSIT